MSDVPGKQRSAVLLLGRGLIGSAVRQRLDQQGRDVVTVAGSGRTGPAHLACDLGSPDGRAALRERLARSRPGYVVLTHGPSDVTWIESHEREAAAAHVGVAEMMAELGVPTVLVSTDNVFDGTRGGRRPGDPINPQNAYGRIKADAERLLLAGGHALVLRVSLVYGWTGERHRATYGQRCLVAASRSEPLEAPTDQDFTPIHVADVAEVVTALCQAERPPTGLAHLSGPEELSRFDFARTAYRLAGADEALVRPCLRQDTEWASRPRYSSLTCDDFSGILGLDGYQPAGPGRGLALMLRTRAPQEALR